MCFLQLLSCLTLASASIAAAPQGQDIRLPRQPRISPDGQSIAFSWQGDLWTAAVDGGEAMRLTVHPAADSRPFFSPDGLEIAFMSERSGTTQMHVVPTTGGKPRQVTRDTHRKYLLGYAADGAHLIIAGTTDRGWTRMESTRLFLIDPEGKEAKRMLFDAGFAEAALAPAAWNRKGYQGPSDPSIEIDSQYDSDCTTCAPAAEKRLPRELG